MDLPKFLIADSSELEDTIFVIHTAYPRFLINEGDCDKIVLWGRSGFDADYKTSGACRDGGESRKIKVTTL